MYVLETAIAGAFHRYRVLVSYAVCQSIWSRGRQIPLRHLEKWLTIRVIEDVSIRNSLWYLRGT